MLRELESSLGGAWVAEGTRTTETAKRAMDSQATDSACMTADDGWAKTEMVCVTRVVTDPEEWKLPAAKKAVRAEVAVTVQYGTMDLKNPKLWPAIRSKDPRATRVRQRMLLSRKFEQRAREDQEYKGRGIAMGCFQRNADGKVVELAGEGYNCDPMRFDDMRSGDYEVLSDPEAELTTADVKSAYLTADLDGDAVWMQPCEAFIEALESDPKWAKEFKELIKLFREGKEVYVKVLKAQYGLQVAGFCFEKHRHDCLAKVGFKLVAGKLSQYRHKDTGALLNAYVDDLRLGCKRRYTKQLWAAIHSVLPLKPIKGSDKLYCDVDDCIGVHTIVQRFDDHTVVKYHQADYAAYCIDHFVREAGLKRLRPVCTPGLVEGESKELLQPGRWGDIASVTWVFCSTSRAVRALSSRPPCDGWAPSSATGRRRLT